MRFLLFFTICFLLCCNNGKHEEPSSIAVKNNDSTFLKVPHNCKITSILKANIPQNRESGDGYGEITLLNILDTVITKYIDTSKGSVSIYEKTLWLLKNGQTNKSFTGSSELIYWWKPYKGAQEEWYTISSSFNDTTENKQNGSIVIRKDTFNIFPPSIKTILPSPDGKYVALVVNQIEAAPVVEIINAPSLLKTGHYDIIKRINPYLGDVSKLVKWDADKLIMESDYNLTGLNNKEQLDDSNDMSNSPRKNYSYDVEKKVFAEYKSK